MGKWNADGNDAPRPKPSGLNSFPFPGTHPWRACGGSPGGMSSDRRMGLFWAYIEDEGVKARVLESMKIQSKSIGHGGHLTVSEELWVSCNTHFDENWTSHVYYGS